ncbi:LytR/AlgR family response regulator transcription factor [Microbacteriaceae bacterium 4G12]
MKILIVSEEAEHRNQIIQALEQEIGKVEFLHAQLGLEAMKLAKRHELDFLFLDIQLTNSNGLGCAELLRQLEPYTKLVVIGDEPKYAIDAFRLRAFYYLLQPFKEEDLSFLSQLILEQQRAKSNASFQRLSVETQEGISYIHPNDVVYISKNKENKTVSIYTKTGSYLSNYTLQDLEEKLIAYTFLRVHKSYLINVLLCKRT